METIKDKLSEYISLHAEIIEAFEQDGWESIEDNTRNRWFFDGGEISFLDKEGVEYCYDSARDSEKEVDGCRLFYIQDNGETFFAMFSSSNRYEDYDEYCAQMGVEV
jgi:hypothetical protein